jgi:hypothetical protein
MEGRHHFSINADLHDSGSDLVAPFLERIGGVGAAV